MSGLFDLEIVSSEDGEVRARVPVTDGCKQPLGLVHGGVYAIIADELTAQGGRVITNQTSFLRPVTAGTIHAAAHRRHRGRTTAVWETYLSDDQQRLCALVRTTIRTPGPDTRR